jgi:hypothetical protein
VSCVSVISPHFTSLLTSLHSSLYFTPHFTSLLTSLHSSLHFTSLLTSLLTSLHSSLHFTSLLTSLHFTPHFNTTLQLRRRPSYCSSEMRSAGGILNLICCIIIHWFLSLFISPASSFPFTQTPSEDLEKLHVQSIQLEMMKWRNSEQSFRHKYSDNLSLSCSHHPLITFVFLGDGSQSSFGQTTASFFQLTHCAWKAIILYSVPSSNELTPDFHIDPPFHLSNILPDPRIAYLPTMNLIQSLESIVLPSIITPWVSFLKVGDRLTPHYLSQLHRDIQLFPEASSVIFQSSASPLTALTVRDRAVLPCYGYALKRSLFLSPSSVNHSSSFQTLSEFISPRILCSGTAVFSPVVTYLSPALTQDLSPSLPQGPTSQSLLISFNNTNCPVEMEAHTVPPVVFPQQVSKREFFSRFYFPDARNAFFEDNIRGLKESLFQLHQLGCIHSNLRVLASFFTSSDPFASLSLPQAEFHIGYQTKVKFKDYSLVQVIPSFYLLLPLAPNRFKLSKSITAPALARNIRTLSSSLEDTSPNYDLLHRFLSSISASSHSIYRSGPSPLPIPASLLRTSSCRTFTSYPCGV